MRRLRRNIIPFIRRFRIGGPFALPSRQRGSVACMSGLRAGLIAVAIGVGLGLAAVWFSPSGDARPAIQEKSAIAGTASVIDGDTVEIHGTRIRFHGIDAPESAQLCDEGKGQQWRCGQRAALALSDLIGQAVVSCDVKDIDQYGRPVAVCHMDDQDLNGWMVKEGWAVAYRQYSSDYISQEGVAKAAGKNIWSGEFAMPWDWRHEVRQVADTKTPARPAPAIPPQNCNIKGNISNRGERIYHVPGGRYYNATQINSSKGERWFCSEAEARAAGWRRSMR